MAVLTTQHSRQRIRERTEISHSEAKEAINNGQYVPIIEEYREGKKHLHLLYYSHTDRAFHVFIVAVQKKSRGRESTRLKTILCCNGAYTRKYSIPSEIYQSAIQISKKTE